MKKLSVFSNIEELSKNQIQSFEDKEISQELKKIENQHLVDSILEALKFKEDDYIGIDAYIDGKPKVLKADKVKSILEEHGLDKPELFDFSFRVTNFQKISKIAMSVQKLIYKKYRRVSTCNLYYTPSTDANCFLFHPDYQQTIVFQLLGKKNWSFLKLSESDRLLVDPIYTNKSQEKTIGMKIPISIGESIIFSHSLVHKAEIEQSTGPSIHLTFSLPNFNSLDIVKDLISKEFYPKTYTNLDREIDSIDDFKSLLSDLEKTIANIDIEKEFKRLQDKKYNSEINTLKKGRNYSN